MTRQTILDTLFVRQIEVSLEKFVELLLGNGCCPKIYAFEVTHEFVTLTHLILEFLKLAPQVARQLVNQYVCVGLDPVHMATQENERCG